MTKNTQSAITTPENSNLSGSTPAFRKIEEVLSRYSLASFHNTQQVHQYLEDFGLRKLCIELEADRIKSRSSDLERSVVAFEEKPFEPNTTIFADFTILR